MIRLRSSKALVPRGSTADHRPHRFLKVPWIWSCPVLLIIVVWQLTGFHCRPVLGSRPYVSMDDAAVQLDSFSEPAVAMSILKREVETLCAAWGLPENAPEEVLWPAESTHIAQTGAGSTNCEAAKDLPLHAESRKKGDRREDLAREALAELKARIRALHGKLLQKSLLIHFHERAWDLYLDCYLDLLTLAPEQADVVLCGRPALACAGALGRTDELTDALRHFTRFSQDSNTVARVQGLLADWSNGKIRGLAANNSSAPEAGELCLASNGSADATLGKP